MFDWNSCLASHSIAFHASGRHELVVHCPFCGEGDPSQHMSISMRGRGWRCLRNPAHHHGKKYAPLLAALLKCTEEHAQGLLGEEVTILPAEDKFGETWRQQLGLKVVTSDKPKSLTLPKEARPLIDYGRFSDMFWNYLYDRGYTSVQAGWIAETYNLHYAIAGKWAYRLIIPVYDRNNKLMTWTGRSILKDPKVRYMTLPSEEALDAPSNLLLGLPLLWRAHIPRCLVVVEGPFDALAVTALGHNAGIYGTCLFGAQISDAQAVVLDQLAERFEQVRLLLDPDAQLRVMGLRDRLPRSCKVVSLLGSLKDPAEILLLPDGVSWLRSLAS